MMSQQFDIIEVLANESLLSLPLNSEADIYRVFDKCVRIYRGMSPRKRIQIHSQGDTLRRPVRACDKTLPIIPTVLIENAIRYSPDTAEVNVNVIDDAGASTVTVENETQ